MAAPLTSGPIDGYAAALLDVARAEGDPEGIVDELLGIASALEASEPLRQALTDTRIPADRKQGIVDELLGSRASKVTVALVGFIVAAGKASDFGAIVRRSAELAAAQQQQAFAEVRAAVDLDDDTLRRLEERLSAATGKRVKAKVIIDPKVLGGVVARVGDTVFDGSVRSRLESLREAWG